MKWATAGNPSSTRSNTSITEKHYTPSQIGRQMFTTLDNFLQMLPIIHRINKPMHAGPYVLFIFKGPGSKRSPPTWTAGGETLVVIVAENKNIVRRNRMESVELK